MKFGKQLQREKYQPWEENYIPYARFKRMLKRKRFEMDQQLQMDATRALSLPADHSLSPSDSNYGTYVDVDTEEHGIVMPIKDPTSEYTPLTKKSSTLSRNISSANIDEFFNLLFVEMARVNEFFKTKLKCLGEGVEKFQHDDVSGHKYSTTLGRGFGQLCLLYGELVALRDFAELNYQGFRKIVKKYDKMMGTERLDEFLKNYLEKQDFVVSSVPQRLIDTISSLVSRDKLLKLEHFAQENKNGDANKTFPEIQPYGLFGSIAVFVIFLNINILAVDDPCASRCLSLLAFVISLWMTKAMPYFATALLIPPLVVFLDVLRDPNDPTTPMSRPESAKFVMDHLVNHITVLILGGYTLSSAISTCQLETWIASKLQKLLGDRPSLFILSIMLLGLFLSMWIGNHTSPILCNSILSSIIHDDHFEKTRFVKALLLGLAFACNFGGMLTPISSMQNALAVTYLDSVGMGVTFGQWILIALPFSLIATLISWAFVVLAVFPLDDVPDIPPIIYTAGSGLKTRHVFVLVLCVATVMGWSTISMTKQIFGDLGIIALCFVGLMFGSGILTEIEFNSFNWHTLFLLGGGNVLGKAVADSHLLDYIAAFTMEHLPLQYPWLTMLVLFLFTCVTATFVSHTVAAIILMPLLVTIGVELENAEAVVLGSAFSVSAAMALPFSSFPNLYMVLQVDDHKKPFLEQIDFLKTGLPLSILSVFLIASIGLVLIKAVVEI